MDYKQVQRMYKKMAKQICTLKLNGCSCENEYVLPKELPILHITQTGINRYIEKENAIYISLSEVNIMLAILYLLFNIIILVEHILVLIIILSISYMTVQIFFMVLFMELKQWKIQYLMIN